MKTHKPTRITSHGSQEWGDANVNRSDTICSNSISTNCYGSNGGVEWMKELKDA